MLLLILMGKATFAQFTISGKFRSFGVVNVQLSNLDGKIIYNKDVNSGVAFASPTIDFTPDYYKLKIANSEMLIFLENKPFQIKGFVDQKNTANSIFQFEGAPFFDLLDKAESNW